MPAGLKCNGTTNKAEWVDGSPIDYIPKDGGIDDSKSFLIFRRGCFNIREGRRRCYSVKVYFVSVNYCYTDCSWYLWNDGHYHSCKYKFFSRFFFKIA